MSVNNHITEWFDTEFGVRQGDSLSPSLFGIYVNDLVHDLKNAMGGISIGTAKLQCLLYSDDIVLFGESSPDLQGLIDILSGWCHKWRMKVNINKSKVMHFRSLTTPQTNYRFLYRNENLETVNRYKYLGLVLNDHLDFNITAGVLADSAGRALGAIYSKFKYAQGLGFQTYSTIIHSGVTPITDYCSGVWGFKKIEKISTIQHRAIRLYLGVHRFAPNPAINGDMGWVNSHIRRKINMLRLWNRLMYMQDNRLTKQVFRFDQMLHRHNWYSEVEKLFNELNMMHIFINEQPVNLNVAKETLILISNTDWEQAIRSMPKLRTYCDIKATYNTEPYVKILLNRSHRSTIAQFRTGILPLRVETGRYQHIPPEDRLCLLCDLNVVEDEYHMLYSCKCYDRLRRDLFEKVKLQILNFEILLNKEKTCILMQENFIKYTAEFIFEAMRIRRNVLYKN